MCHTVTGLCARPPERSRQIRLVVAAFATVLAWLCAATPAHAGSTLTSITVSITITAACTINTISPTLSFGSVSGASLATTDATANTTISVTCTNGSPFAIGLDNGLNALVSQRRMASGGAAYLNYGLYQTSDTTKPWTAATNSTTCATSGNCVLGTGAGSPVTITIYGDVPSGQTPAAAIYSDTVGLTIYY